MILLTPEVSKLIFFHVAEVINSLLSMNVGIYTQLSYITDLDKTS